MSTTTTLRAPRVPKLPSIDEMTDQLRERMPGLTVYNPSHEWLNPEFHGRTGVWIPPDKGGIQEPHPVTGVPIVCNGEGEIKGRFLKQKDSSGKVITGQDAESAVKFLCHIDNYGQMGLAWLPKLDTQQDQDIKAAAKTVYAEYQRSIDNGTVQKRREFKANWEKTHKGQPCPPPTERENSAIERQQDFTHAKTYLYECSEEGCPGYATNDWGKMELHAQKAHKARVRREEFEAGMVAGDVESSPSTLDTPVKRGPGRPRKVAQIPAE